MTSAVCFIAGTLILTADGEVPIEDIKSGDKVWTYNIDSGEEELAEVPNIFARNSQEFIKLHFAGDLSYLHFGASVLCK